jgi:hypothetical protein
MSWGNTSALQKQVVDLSYPEAMRRIAGFAPVGHQGADTIYRNGNVYVRLSPLPGGRVRMVMTTGSCAC